MADDRPIETLSYEEAFAELESIITALESGQLTLEQTTILFERGQVLVRHCAALLEQAELKIRRLNGENLVGLEE
ncbi:MAG: exodeoxyribonuclease VII small subunit [Anaerolineales bacterium]|nr:exodeoxyribonuclease VII small subunit [Anaerolineales bacterium]MCX7609337.1 exodeoxyribonuclease VII small subunit [Anaerolineales bacterium]MDW8227622.1 exodeoxyribonuclease VII small subunit [Anaerolineales bacterium]